MPKIEVREGNQFLFLMFTGCNFLLFLSSLGILGCAIYLFVILETANLFDVSFLLIALTLLLLTFCGFKLKKSPGWMKCFLYIQLIIFTFMLIASLVLLLNTSKVETWAEKLYNKEKLDNPSMTKGLDDFVDELSAQLEAVSYALLVFTGVLGSTIAFGWCYKESTLDRTF